MDAGKVQGRAVDLLHPITAINAGAWSPIGVVAVCEIKASCDSTTDRMSAWVDSMAQTVLTLAAAIHIVNYGWVFIGCLHV